MLKKHIDRKVNDFFAEHRPQALRWVNRLLFYASFIGLAFFLYEIGFSHHMGQSSLSKDFFKGFLLVMFVLLTLRLVLMDKVGIRKGWLVLEYVLIIALILSTVLTVFSWQVFSSHTILGRILDNNLFTFAVILYVFLTELSKRALHLYHLRYNPALLFVVSFLVLIFLGTGLLMLPRATVGGISLLDALFTSASAVCVTGLIVVDTATYFTSFGKTIIIVLIQLGGLGIMTFTSFLAMVFRSGSSFQNQLFLKDMVNEENIGNTMRTIGSIVGITFLVEAMGAAFIYASLSPEALGPERDRLAFSVFHSISAFCNAGFSTLSDGLYDTGIRHNYGFQMVIIGLVIIGGLGFPIIFNLYRHVREIGRNRFRQIRYSETYVHTSRVINVNTKIVLITTAALLAAGFVLYFMTEYNSTLRDRSWLGKIVTSLFGAVTPRTAGFNTVDMTQLTLPIILVYLLLMWIGASPGSTGGGIKTTTFALAVLNTYNIAQGKDRVEAFGREIAGKSVQQAFAVMLLSFLVIGMATLALVFFNPEMQLVKAAFEAFSAFSTVGLSLGVTGELTSGSKVVIIITMFLGRVGIFTLIASVLTKVNTYYYRYPTESIIIT